MSRRWRGAFPRERASKNNAFGIHAGAGSIVLFLLTGCGNSKPVEIVSDDGQSVGFRVSMIWATSRSERRTVDTYTSAMNAFGHYRRKSMVG